MYAAHPTREQQNYTDKKTTYDSSENYKVLIDTIKINLRKKLFEQKLEIPMPELYCISITVIYRKILSTSKNKTAVRILIVRITNQ